VAVSDFTFKKLDMYGACLITPFVSTDQRGSLIKDYNINTFNENGINCSLKETFYTVSKKGVIRAVHFQYPQPQPKLIRCISGHIYDVIVDLRHGSPTWGRHLAVELSADNGRQMFIPRGFAHGFAVMSDVAQFQYKVDNVYDPQSEATLRFDDPALDIDWRIAREDMILSEKDLKGLPLDAMTPEFLGF
jgi:dTDP-4-dehydrorhamnose 3,5-epimerase